MNGNEEQTLMQRGGENPFRNIIGDMGVWWQRRQSFYYEKKREKALGIINMMRKYYPNRYQEYKKSMQPDEVGKTELSFPEGTNNWAEIVVDKYGDVLSPEEELSAKKARMTSKAISKVMGTGGGAPTPLSPMPQVQLPEPTLGPQPQMAPQAMPRPMPQPQPQQGGMTREMSETILGFRKPGDALKRVEVMLKAMGILDQQTKTQISTLRAKIDEMAETRAEKEFGEKEAREKSEFGKEFDLKERKLTEEQLKNQQTAINRVYDDIGKTMRDLSRVEHRLEPEDRLKREQQTKIEGLRRLLAIDPKEAKNYGTTVTEGIISASRAIVTDINIMPSAKTAGVLDEFKINLTTLSQIVGLGPIREALKARFGYLAERKDRLNDREKSLLALWHRWLSELGVKLEPLTWETPDFWKDLLQQLTVGAPEA